MILYTKQKQVIDMESRFVVDGGGGSRMDGEFGVGGYKLYIWNVWAMGL